jgi:methionyl-tRNA formyltransferase
MRIIFFGTPFFAVPSLLALLRSEAEVVAVVTQPDKPKGRNRIPTSPPVKDVALNNGIVVLQPSTMRDSAFLERLKNVNPDIIVVVAYGKILPPHILHLPAYGCINVHASLLPKYRGAAPIQWAIINGEKQTGITTMLMDEGLDTGDILLQKVVDITDDDTSESLSRRLADIGASLLVSTVDNLSDSSLKPLPQEGIPSYAPPIKKEDGCIDWKQTAKEICNFVRGMYPWPCAYCYLEKERIKITRVAAIEGSGHPGRIVRTSGEFIVGTGKGLISIIELQPEGKKPMHARDFLRGRKIQEGSFFHEP